MVDRRLTHLSTKVRSITSPTQGRSCDSQTTDHKNDAKKKEADGSQERAKTKVYLNETQRQLGDEGDEGDELAEARDERCEDQHENIDAVSVHRRHRAVPVPRAREEAR